MMTRQSRRLWNAAKAAAMMLDCLCAEVEAGESDYGINFEALVDDEWVHGESIDEDDDVDVEAVRLFDRDGNRGGDCETVAALAEDVASWAASIQHVDPTEAEVHGDGD